MRYIWLVALREFGENARTKGFWISLLLFPVMLLASFWITEKLEKATPTRLFVLVDQSGEFEDIALQGLERLHQRDVFMAFGEWVKESVKTDAATSERSGRTLAAMLERSPADPAELLEQFSRANPDALDAFTAAGGVDFAIQQMQPLLKEGAAEFQEPRPRFRRVDLPAGVDAAADLETLAEQLRPCLKGARKVTVDGEQEELFAAVLIPRDVAEHVERPVLDQLREGKLPAQLSGLGAPAGAGETAPPVVRRGIQYWAVNVADDDLKDEIETVINAEVRRREYLARGVDADAVRSVQSTRVPFQSLDPRKAVGEEQVSPADRLRQWAPVGFVYLLWISIFTISQMLLNNTIEEKSNRIIEVLLSSVTAGELMLGKLFGIAAVGLTMVTAWIISMIAILAFKVDESTTWAVALYTILQKSNLLPAFALYFILGYFLYAGIFLSVGAMCSSLKEAQNLMGVIMLVMIVPLMTMMFIPRDPNGTLATIMSWIPLYTPFTMMNRAAADPPAFDVWGTGILLLVFTLTVLWLSGKIFRAAILRTGQLPRFIEVLRWIRS